MNTKHTGDHRHRTEVRYERIPRTSPFTLTTAHFATCECGWVGLDMVTRRDAENDADEHVRSM